MAATRGRTISTFGQAFLPMGLSGGVSALPGVPTTFTGDVIANLSPTENVLVGISPTGNMSANVSPAANVWASTSPMGNVSANPTPTGEVFSG